MKFYSVFLVIVLSLCLTSCSKSQNSESKSAADASSKPIIKLSRDRLPASGWLVVTGSGFAPKQEVRSHLKRPDGSEYPEVAILTDDKGGFIHDIDTLLFSEGKYEVWVIDSNGVSSNIAPFDATKEQGTFERPDR